MKSIKEEIYEVLIEVFNNGKRAERINDDLIFGKLPKDKYFLSGYTYKMYLIFEIFKNMPDGVKESTLPTTSAKEKTRFESSRGASY